MLGIGAVLSQTQSDGSEKVIAYASRSLNAAERNYCATRLEMLALVHFVEYFRYYLLGRRFTVRTDHNALKWLLTFKNPQGQVARWLERLQEYDFQIIHRPGKLHANADGLSRKPHRARRHGDCPTCNDSSFQVVGPEVAAINTTLPQSNTAAWSPQDVMEAQCADPDIYPVLERLWAGKEKPDKKVLQGASPVTRAIWAQYELISIQDGILSLKTTQGYRTVLPASLLIPALQELHDGVAGNHLGQQKTLCKVKARFWRPGLSTAVHDYCNLCVICAKCKPGRRMRAPLQPIGSGYPMQRVHMDIVGPLPRTRRGNRYILTVQCSFTKWVEAYPLSNQRATTCARAFVKNWVYRYGVPDSIHSDQGRNFQSKVFTEMCELLQMKKTKTTAYHPQGNGQIENFHRTLKSLLKTKIGDLHDRWDEHLDSCLMAYRGSVHSSTGHTPFNLMFGHEMRVPLDVMMAPDDKQDEQAPYSEFVSRMKENLSSAFQSVRSNLATAQKRQKEAFDKGIKRMSYVAGDVVLKFNPQLREDEVSKFHWQWTGPYKVLERITEVTYRIQKENEPHGRSTVVHFNNLRLLRRCTDREEDEVSCASEQLGTIPEALDRSSRRQASNRHEGDTETEVEDPVGEPECSGDNTDDLCELSTLPYEVPEVATETPNEEEDGNSDEENGTSDDSQPSCSVGSPRPIRQRRPPDRYGEWVTSLQITKDHFDTLVERIQVMEERNRLRERRIRKMKPKWVERGRELRLGSVTA